MSRNNAMAKTAAQNIVVAGLTREQVALVKRTICEGYSDDELRLYLYQCESMGLDPLARETYTFKAGGKVVIGISIDGFRRRADETGCYAPGKPTEYIEDDTGKLIAARVWVRKLVGDVWHDVSEDAYLSEFKGKGNWNVMPRVMLSKCAEARALRRAFPAKFTGLYAPEERASIERAAGEPTTQAQRNVAVWVGPESEPERPALSDGTPPEVESQLDGEPPA